MVVGGGVIGTACCHSLAEAGFTTALIERDQVGSGASGACEGNVLVSDKSPGPELDLAKRSLELFHGIEQRLEADVQCESKGSLLVATTPDAADELKEQMGWMSDAGLEIELLDAAATREAEPVLRPDIAAGLVVADDLQVCPLSLVAAFTSASARLGTHVIQGCEVEAIELVSGRVASVRTERGDISCSSVVVAAGVSSRTLLEPLGFSLPLVGRRGQILVGAPTPGLIRRKVYDFGYRATVVDHDQGVQVATVLETTRRGNVLIGASREFRETASASDAAVDALLAARALELAPGLAGIQILRSYAGVRPTLRDSIPVIGELDGAQGLWLACGHEGAGIGLAPATAELICSLISGGEPLVEPAAFSPDRLFSGHGESSTRVGRQ